MVRKHPPARAVLGIKRPWQTKGRKANPERGQRFVDDIYRRSGNAAALNITSMNFPFIHGRVALADASTLIDLYGDEAGFEAAARAQRSRDDGNVARFCHWRQIERLIATLSSDEVQGTIH
jgi:hypothetical protein